MKKGFTLIELLAVIVILLVILSIAVPPLLGVLNASRSKTYSLTVKSIENSAKLYVGDHPEDFSDVVDGDFEILYISDLCSGKYLSCPVYNPDTEVEMTGYVSVTRNGDTFDYVYNEGQFIDYRVCFIFDSNTKTITGYDEENPICPNDVVIPSNINGVAVEHIGDRAFFLAPITSVIIPNTVTTIGDDAFWQDYNLKSITIPGNVISIGSGAFEMSALTSVTIENGVKSIGNFAFISSELTSVTIPSSVTSIGSQAFEGNQLTSVTFLNSATDIGGYAFDDNQITNVALGNSIKSIGGSAFYSNQLTSLTIPGSVTNIGFGAFNNNQLPDNQAFIYKRNSNGTVDNTTIVSYGGAKRDNVVIPNGVASIEQSAFQYNQLTSLTIPSGVTYMGDSAFADNQLANVTIPTGVTSIGEWAFQDNQLTNVTIPNTVTSIESRAFNNNQLPDAQAFIYKRNSNGTVDNTTIVSYGGAERDNIVIPTGVTNIGWGAFDNSNITSVTIPNTVASISYYAFYLNQLTSVTIPSSVTYIGSGAFSELSTLTSVTIQGANPQRFNGSWTSIGFPAGLMP